MHMLHWHTLRRTVRQPSATLTGYTIRRIPVQVQFLPYDQGLAFEIAGVGPCGYIPVNLNTLQSGRFSTPLGDLILGWTEATNGHYGLGVVEHVLGACVLANVTDVLIRVSFSGKAPFVKFRSGAKVASMPLFDGSATPYVDALHAAGLQSLGPAQPWQPKARISLNVGTGRFSIQPRAKPGWSLHLTQNNPPAHQAPWWQGQHTELLLDTADPRLQLELLGKVAGARPTHSTASKLWLYRLLALGAAQPFDFMVGYTKRGQFRPGQRPYGQTEGIYHRALDVCGDLFAALGPVQADVHLHYPSHAHMHHVRQHVRHA